MFPEFHRPLECRGKELRLNEQTRYADWRRYARGGTRFSLVNLLGEVRSRSARRSPTFLDWLAKILRLEGRTVRQCLNAWHGHGNLRRIFARHWPPDVHAVPANVLCTLTVEATLYSPSLVRLLSSACRLSPGQALRRLHDSRRKAPVRDAFPELSSLRLVVFETTSPAVPVAS